MTEEIGTSNLLRTWANDGTVVVPANAKIDEGWLRGEQPPHEWMNYIHNSLGQKVNHALSRGVADWNSTTLYLVGSLVRHDGRAWMSFVENSNSEPSSANSDWSVVQDARSSVVDEEIVVTVGSSGDFSTIESAVEHLSRLRIGFSQSANSVRIRMLSGFAMEEQLFLFGINLSWIVLEAEDATVPIVRSALTRETDLGESPAFYAESGAFLPVIGCQFEMESSGSAAERHGIVLGAATGCQVRSGCGVRNAGGIGLKMRAGATASAGFSDFSGANGSNGVVVRNGATCAANNANFRQGAEDSSTDARVQSGGIIVFNGGTGGTNITPNEITSNGIIFK